jgi:hypothetical protein
MRDPAGKAHEALVDFFAASAESAGIAWKTKRTLPTDLPRVRAMR